MSKKKNKNNVKKCHPDCPFFPDMSVESGEWVYDEKEPYIKRRKKQKVFKCIYDGHKIDWNLPCVREENINGKR